MSYSTKLFLFLYCFMQGFSLSAATPKLPYVPLFEEYKKAVEANTVTLEIIEMAINDLRCEYLSVNRQYLDFLSAKGSKELSSEELVEKTNFEYQMAEILKNINTLKPIRDTYEEQERREFVAKKDKALITAIRINPQLIYEYLKGMESNA